MAGQGRRQREVRNELDDLAERIKGLALSVGFDLAGVAPAVSTPETLYLREWLAQGYGGSMGYLERRCEERVDPRKVLEGAQSIVAVGLVYAANNTDGEAASDSTDPVSRGRISRYARGADYHDVMIERLRSLETAIEALVDGPVSLRSYVDTGPVQERVFAAYGGLGWIGKNTCLIHPRLGSYVFLGVLLTDLALAPDVREPDHCGTCRACLDACPTDAFVAPYQLDATRCIAYSTIEDRGPIAVEQRAEHSDRMFGCDICQEVCPWNQHKRPAPPDTGGLREQLQARPEWVQPSLHWVLGLTQESWKGAAARTALRRSRYQGLIRNALVVAGNVGDPSLRTLIERHASGQEALLAEHATWALEEWRRRGL